MSIHVRTDRVLVGISVAWVTALLATPTLQSLPEAFLATVVLIAANAVVSFRTLTRTRRVLVGLSCAQIALFAVLNYQLYAAFGAEHYECDRAPCIVDWCEFTLAHLFRAADVLDALDEYGMPIQVIMHRSLMSGVLLVGMHLTVDVFLIGLALRWLGRWWQTAQRETYLERGRRDFGWLMTTLGLYGVFAILLPLKPWDWLLWPLDNVLRLLDVGDMFQIFGWQLHSVEGNYWTRGAGLLFRLVAGFWTARLVIWLRMTMLRTWGLSVEELTELLDDPDAQVRRGAAIGLGQTGARAREATPALSQSLRDPDHGVRLEAARALAQMGASASMAVQELTEAMWLGDRDMRLAAIAALANIGPVARAAVHPLITMLKVADPDTCAAVHRAVERIAPAIHRRLLALDDNPPPVRMRTKMTKRDYWKKSLQAAQSLQATEELTRALLCLLVQEGFFDQERDTDAVRLAFAEKGHEVQYAQLFLPLLTLTSAGALARRQSPVGRWVYLCISVKQPSAMIEA
jgi:HEAT repeat protein